MLRWLVAAAAVSLFSWELFFFAEVPFRRLPSIVLFSAGYLSSVVLIMFQAVHRLLCCICCWPVIEMFLASFCCYLFLCMANAEFLLLPAMKQS
jgi:hypothetical protein